MATDLRRNRVLLVPGGGSSVAGYFREELTEPLRACAEVIAVDPLGLDVEGGRRWLTLSAHARWLAQSVEGGSAPVVVVAHSLGALVALRLALDRPELVAGLVLLDPSPLMPGALLPELPLTLVAAARKLVRNPARRGRALPPPRAIAPAFRLAWYVGFDVVALAADLSTRALTVPTVVVSAGENPAGGAARRSHERLVTWIDGAELEVWEHTGHNLHQSHAERVAQLALSLLPALPP